MKKIVARNVGIIVGLSVLFSAVVTGCGKTATPEVNSNDSSVVKKKLLSISYESNPLIGNSL